ncbi:MAG TPA: sulfatase-like hydrolase/transferase [Steroidobacteraceae bacterium]|nr:sulfatase-like hydrolase/transferase [Steroidobacteraceae bacterium]
MPNDFRAWRIVALPCFVVLGIALPLTFASHCDQFLYDFRAIDLLPLYATAWLILAAVAVPFWILATLALRGLESVQRRPGPLLARALRWIFLAVAGAVLVATLISCLRAWLGTFGSGIPLSANGALALAILIGVLAAVTARGRSALRALAPVATVCTVAGLLSLVTLPIFGWPKGGLEQQPLPAIKSGGQPAPADSDQARQIQTSATLPDPGAARPNIVLLSVDALSAPHMSLYGYARPTTPKLAGFARGATTFDRAYANGNYTTPGVATILTGTLPWTHRALQLPVWPLTRTRVTSLPAVLERAGYRTGYVSTNAIAGASKQGFGRYFQFARTDRTGRVTLCSDGLSRYLRYVCAASELSPLQELDGFAAYFHRPDDNLEHDPRLAIQPALHWLATVDRSRPIFLWVHLFPPHSPYAAPPPWLGRFDPSDLDRTAASTQPHWAWIQSQLPAAQVRALAARYDEAVAYADSYAGEFLTRALELLGPNTAVIVTADHGESFAHGYGAHTGPGLYDEIIHIPLILKLPHETTAKRCDTPVQQADIAPTLAALAGVSAPADWQGESLLDACAGTETQLAPAPRPIFSMNFEQNPRFARLKTGSVAVIRGRWKLIHYMGALHYPYMPPLRDELYDLVADPGERHDLAAAQPAVVQQLRALIDAALAQYGGRVLPGKPAPPAGESAALPQTAANDAR